MSAGAKFCTSTRPAAEFVRPRRTLPQRGLPDAILLATMLATMAGPGAAIAQNCSGQCLLDRLFLANNCLPRREGAGDRKIGG